MTAYGGNGSGSGDPAIAITVTGIPAAQNGWFGIVGLGASDYEELAFGIETVTGGTLTASLAGLGGGAFTTPWTYFVFLMLENGFDIDMHIPSRNITAGSNTIPWSDFLPFYNY